MIAIAIDLPLLALAARRANLGQSSVLDAHIEANDGQYAEEQKNQAQVNGHMQAQISAKIQERAGHGCGLELKPGVDKTGA